jgi:hypothetical protein
MNRLLFTILFGTSLAFGQAPSTSTSTATAASPQVTQTSHADQDNAQKARKVIDQMIDALGGNAYLNVEDISQEGRTYTFYHGRPSGTGLLFWRFARFPDKERIELTKKRDVSYVYNGDKGYEITYKGTAIMDPKTLADYLRRRSYSLDWVLRRWLHEPGVALFDDGPAIAEQKPAEQITIMNAENESVTIFVDPDTHLPIKKSFSWRDPTDKQKNVEDEVYDNYRPVQGIMTPYSVSRSFNGDMSNQRFINSIQYNTGVSDSLFTASATYDPNKPPEKK